MPYDTRSRSRSSFLLPSFSNGVKWLVIANVAIYLIDFFGSMMRGDQIFSSLVLMPAAVVRGAVWQLVTYMFLHSLGSFWHILFNMLTLWMFGSAVEETWGTRRFLQYYFICGIGAGICVVVANLLFGDPNQRVIGASGAIYGLLLAYGMLFPNQTVMMSFLFPIKAKYMVMIFGAIAFLSSFQTGSTVSNLAHLGGMLFGFIYIKTQFSARRAPSYGGTYLRSAPPPGSGPRFSFSSFNPSQWWKEYKLRRARKKFTVYMKEHGSGRDIWKN
jgi:membrane associated rhomboid family serine protease